MKTNIKPIQLIQSFGQQRYCLEHFDVNVINEEEEEEEEDEDVNGNNGENTTVGTMTEKNSKESSVCKSS